MNENYSQFLIAVGDACAAAALADLFVEVLTTDGSRISGVPGSIANTNGGDEVDDTGYARTFRIDDAVVRLDQVVECVIRAPASPKSTDGLSGPYT